MALPRVVAQKNGGLELFYYTGWLYLELLNMAAILHLFFFSGNGYKKENSYIQATTKLAVIYIYRQKHLASFILHLLRQVSRRAMV